MTNATSTKRRRRMAREPQADADVQLNAGSDASSPSRTVSASRDKAPSKADKVVALLQRPGGATLDELVEATGWLPHTTRAALTGLKKKGHPIERSKVDGTSRYAVVETAKQ